MFIINYFMNHLNMNALNGSICLFCKSTAGFVFVHGHYQCMNCKNVMIKCCEGETCQHAEPIPLKPGLSPGQKSTK